MFGNSLLTCPRCGFQFWTKPESPRLCPNCGLRPAPPPPPPNPPEQMIRAYKNGLKGKAQDQFQRDAKKLAHQRWRVQNVTVVQRGTVNLGFGLGVSIGDLVVVYTRD